MPQPTTLEGALQSLSDIQKQVVEWHEDALLVLAGPGSGKTRVLTTRIAKLIDDSPDEHFRVLALTFTNRAADEMRERVELMVPNAEDRLYIGTFHSFAAEILRQHGQHLGLKTDFSIYSTDEDRKEIALGAINSDEGREAGLHQAHLRFLRPLSIAKSKLVKPDGLKEKYPNWSDAAAFEAFYKAYDAQLMTLNAIDFDSLIYKAHELFKRYSALASRQQTVYRFWCVDEFQDTNLAQYQFLRAMAGDTFKNIFAVADDDQIMYQWNGADYRRLDQFRADFDAALLQIPTNFRCPAEVVQCANNLITHNLLRSSEKEPLIAARSSDPDNSVIALLEFDTAEEEAVGIADHIATHYPESMEDVAVLARGRNQLNALSEALSDRGIDNIIIVRRDEFQSPHFNWLHNTLRLMAHKNDERFLSAMSGTFQQLFDDGLSISDILSYANAERVDLFTAWENIARQQNDISETIEFIDLAANLNRGAIDYLRFASEAVALIERCAQQEQSDDEPDQYSYAIADDISAWQALSGEVARAIGPSSNLESFLQELDLRSKEPPVGPNTIPLMTIHGSKGNEFDHVYLIGLVEDILPSFQSLKKGDRSPEFEEERRNCFVALTRTQETLTLSFARNYAGWSKTPSRFLTEMGLSVLAGPE